jgi:hypothetical protein
MEVRSTKPEAWHHDPNFQKNVGASSFRGVLDFEDSLTDNCLQHSHLPAIHHVCKITYHESSKLYDCTAIGQYPDSLYTDIIHTHVS